MIGGYIDSAIQRGLLQLLHY